MSISFSNSNTSGSVSDCVQEGEAHLFIKLSPKITNLAQKIYEIGLSIIKCFVNDDVQFQGLLYKTAIGLALYRAFIPVGFSVLFGFSSGLLCAKFCRNYFLHQNK